MLPNDTWNMQSKAQLEAQLEYGRVGDRRVGVRVDDMPRYVSSTAVEALATGVRVPSSAVA